MQFPHLNFLRLHTTMFFIMNKKPVHSFSVLFPVIIFFLLAMSASMSSFGQGSDVSGELKNVLEQSLKNNPSDPGLQLINNQQYEAANSYFNQSIKANDLNADAYLKRGIVNWQQSDTTAACRDWSSVLALGDTATYMLLTKNCHGNMIIEEEVIPVKKFKTLFADGFGMSKSEAEKSAHVVVDVMPAFPGGDEALIKYLKTNTQYPKAATANKTQGRVYVNFIISKSGKVLYPYAAKKIGSGCDEEAVRVIKNMPAWKPGMKNGKPVLVRYTLPVKFALN